MTHRPFRVLAISGSLRAESLSRKLAEAVARNAPEGVEIDVYDGLRGIPPYDQDIDTKPAPAPVADLRERIGRADALFFSTPEYNHSVPGVLKNAVDWASRPYGLAQIVGTPAAVAGISTSAFGGVWAANELRKVLAAAGARVVHTELGVKKADTLLDEHGRFADQGVIGAALAMVQELQAEADLAAREAAEDAA